MKDYISILRSAVNKKIDDNTNWTQVTLAQEFGLSQSKISKMLSGKQTSASNLEMIAERLDVTVADLFAQARVQPEADFSPGASEAILVGTNHEAAQPSMRNRIRDALRLSFEVNISVIAVALRYTWPFLKVEVPAILSSISDDRRVNINLGMVSPTLLADLSLKKWMDAANNVRNEIESFVNDPERDPRITVSLFSYKNLPHWHGLLIDSSELFLGRTRWNQEVNGKWQLSVGQEPYRLYSAERPGGLERIRMFLSWFEWYRYVGEGIFSNRPIEGSEEDDDPDQGANKKLGHS